MTRTLAAVFVMGALLSLPLTSFALPSLNDTSYSAYCKGPCDTCVTGERAAQSVTMWVTSPTVTERWPQNPWLTVRVNGRDTALGKDAVVLDGQFMLPVMAAEEFGLTATRSGLHHRFLQLSGGRYPVKLTIGTRQAEVGYALRSLPVAPKWHNGKVYMPFETIAGYLDWTLTFDGPSGVLAVQTRGSDLTSHMNTATWAHSRGLYDEAVEQWQKAIALEDDDWYLYQRLGDALAGAGRNDEALAAYDQALSLAPLTAPALRTQAARYQNAGDPAKAIEAYRKALAIDPNYIESRIELGQALINSGDLAGAEQEARRAIALAPDNPFAHNVLGYALRKQGKDDDAVLSYLKAIELAPNYALAYNNLGVALLSLGRPGDAESMLSQAVALAPSRSDFQANLARALLDNGKLNPAIDAWVAAVKLAPDVTEYRAGLAAVLLKHGSVEGALRESTAALANYDANLANLNTLQSRGAAGNEAMQSEALSILDAARLRATCVKAWALLEKGRAAEAQRVADDALALDGKDIAAQAVMAAVLVETLDAKAAAAAVAGPVGVTPPNELYAAIAAAAYALAGQTEDAEKQLSVAAPLLEAGASRWTWYFLGRAYAALGQSAEAVEMFSMPQPDRYDTNRRAQIADFIARHRNDPKGLRAVSVADSAPQDDPAPVVAQAGPTIVPTAEAAVATVQRRALGEVEVTTTPSGTGRAALKLVNNSDTGLTVIIERRGTKQLWGLPAGQTTEARELEPGDYSYTVRGPQSLKVSGTRQFETGNLYVMTFSAPQ